MGSLIYPGVSPIEIDDRLLAHLRTVTVEKLKRREATLLTVSDGVKQRSFWISSYIPIVFELSIQEKTPLDKDIIDNLRNQANSPRGLLLRENEGD